MNKGGYLSEESIKIYNDFQRQAGKIHDMHIRNEENTDTEIAKKRINKYFKGELDLSWKSIIYEINKLPELERNKYFKDLVDQQKAIERAEQTKMFLEAISHWSIFTFIKERKKAPKFIEIQNNFINKMKGH